MYLWPKSPRAAKNNKHSEATTDGDNIEEASEHEAEHATQKPTHPNETAEHEPKVDSVKEHLDEVKEHANEIPSLSTSDADLLVEEQSIPDEESYVPVELHHQEVPEDDPKLEKLQDTEAHAENERSLPDENSEMDDEAPDHSSPALPAVAWWEKETHATTPAPGNPSDSSWLSRSPPRDKDITLQKSPNPDMSTHSTHS
jgi:hypothetical protein